MWQRFTLYDVRVIGHYLGVLVLFSSLALLVPFVTALACAEWTPATHYLLTIGIALIVDRRCGSCASIRVAQSPAGARRYRVRVDRARVRGGGAAVPVGPLPQLPRCPVRRRVGPHHHRRKRHRRSRSPVDADNMWRFMMHLLGGFGLIVVALSFGLFGKRAGASLYMSEGRSEHVVPTLCRPRSSSRRSAWA